MTIQMLLLKGLLLVSFAACGKKDYLPDFKQAVVDSNVEKVESLLTRKNKLSKKQVSEIAAWADDLVEERKVLQPSVLELTSLGLGLTVFVVSSVSLLRYLANVGYSRTKESPFQKKLSYAKFGVGYSTSLLCGLYYLYKPRTRLASAYKTKFALEKACEGNC